jgi:adenylylsulfate kinase-like enzyme
MASESRQRLIIVTGIQAAGKPTVSRLLAERFSRGVHVEGDVLQKMIVSGNKGVQEPDQAASWRSLGNLSGRHDASDHAGYRALDRYLREDT